MLLSLSGGLLLLRQSLCLLGIFSAAGIFLGLGLRFQLRLSRGFCVRFGFSLRIRRSFARCFFSLRLFSP